MKHSIKITSIIVASVLLMSFDLPASWFKAGSKPKSYEMGVDKETKHDGINSATIKSIDKKIDGFGTLMQQCKPDKYLGKRIKKTGFVKSEDVKNFAGLWLRVDQEGSQEPLSFDNMYNRPIKGTTEWTMYQIILDVPENASLIAYGALLNGTGQIWFDNISFEIVDDTVKTTGTLKSKRVIIPNEPSNLNFEK